MRVRFLGTGTSSGVPVVGCDCETCQSNDPLDRRWRPSIYLELSDATRVLVDTTPDFRTQALAYGITGLDVILFTHYHADHIMGLDDVRPFNFRQPAAIPCLGDASTLAALRRVFAYAWDPASPRGGARRCTNRPRPLEACTRRSLRSGSPRTVTVGSTSTPPISTMP